MTKNSRLRKTAREKCSISRKNINKRGEKETLIARKMIYVCTHCTIHNGSVSCRLTETRLCNPPSALQSLTQLCATLVQGISSCIRHSLNPIPHPALPT